MDRLRSLTGGQPLRSDDWGFIQNSIQEVFGQLVDGLKENSGACIISGCEITTNYDTEKITVSNGYIYASGEIFRVTGGTFDLEELNTDNPEQEAYQVFFKEAFTTSELRTFKDTTTKQVYELRRYETRYTDMPEQDWIAYPDRLTEILSEHILAGVSAPPPQVLIKSTTAAIPAYNFDQYYTIINSPGEGKMIKVLGIAAKLDVTTKLEAGEQDLMVFYGDDSDSLKIGKFLNYLLESTNDIYFDMEKITDEMAVNQPVRVQWDNATAPASGSATIKFYCLYAIITV